MALENINPTETIIWKLLEKHFEEIKNVSIQQMFAEDKHRSEKFHIKWNDFILDYSKNRINETSLKLLLDLAKEAKLATAIEKYFSGDIINKTENRAVLHTALRLPENAEIQVDGKNVVPEIHSVKNKIKEFSNDIINGKRKGFTGKEFSDVVNIGIGGSDLGPDMVVNALKFYKNHLNIHFVSNIDGDHVAEIIKKLNPETTLFVVVSKTFSTQETLSNAETLRKWFLQSASQSDVFKHFVAVSSNIENATSFGIAKENIFPMWDWVGGRFSLWSAVGLSISLSVGFDNFNKLTEGAYEMDKHFKTAPLEKNIPVILGLLSIWYSNFYGADTEAIIPYTHYLQKLAPYLQQSVMESNGKSTDRNGMPVQYQTGSIVWGEPGTNSQHAFFQLIHQGTKIIPIDFIGFAESLHGNKEHHDKLMSNFFAQTEALLNGKNADKVKEAIADNMNSTEAKFIVPFKVFKGNKPTNTLLIQKLTPHNLGALIALYEHKIFVQGVIWNIFSYDQWGVELGKQLADSILNEINSGEVREHDNSTVFLIRQFLKNR